MTHARVSVGHTVRTTFGKLLLSASVGLMLCTSTVHAQKYFPDHPEVEAIANKAAEALRGGGGLLEQDALAGLAVLQHAKRYRQVVPKDDAFLQGIADKIVKDFPADESDDEKKEDTVVNKKELYYPCLALIYLAEYDSKKYESYVYRLLKMLERRQLANGSFTYLKQTSTADTSQTQYAALALFVAKQHDFEFDPEIAKKALNWLCTSQQQDGTWRYKLTHNRSAGDPGSATPGSKPTLSIQAAAASSVYLLADLLNLSKRSKSMSSKLQQDVGLPRTVTTYIKPKEGAEKNPLKQAGPLVKFERSKIAAANRNINAYFEREFTVDIDPWCFYYLYAFERYAYFREQAEGNIGRGNLESWYDESVVFFKEIQDGKGFIFREGVENRIISTSFALLVLVRSSEVLVTPVADTELIGGEGFRKDVVIRKSKNGIRAVEAEKNLEDLLSMMKDRKINQEQLAELTESLKKQVVEFRKKDDKSRGEIMFFLRSMVGAKDYYRRLIAVRFLAGEQNMDNVPALLYALGDPDFRICLEAHNGLRLISRKIDSLSLSDSTQKNSLRDPDVLDREFEVKSRMRLEYDNIKKKWTDWYLKIRPSAELFD